METASNSDSDTSMNSNKEIEVISNSKRKSTDPQSKPSDASTKGKKIKFTPKRTGPPRTTNIVQVDLDDEADEANHHSFGHPGFAPLKDFIALKSKVEA